MSHSQPDCLGYSYRHQCYPICHMASELMASHQIFIIEAFDIGISTYRPVCGFSIFKCFRSERKVMVKNNALIYFVKDEANDIPFGYITWLTC